MRHLKVYFALAGLMYLDWKPGRKHEHCPDTSLN